MDMQGFDAGEETLPGLPPGIEPQTVRTLVEAVAAIIAGATPEELAEQIRSGCPAAIAAAIARPGELEELEGHVALLLSVAIPEGE